MGELVAGALVFAAGLAAGFWLARREVRKAAEFLWRKEMRDIIEAVEKQGEHVRLELRKRR